ncbi:MAG TPA: hypothetical protein VGK32_04690 [Vicinamibacterales bacterium]|jgi:hypothetical protein
MALSRLAMSVGVACLKFEQEGREDAVQSLKTYGLDLCKAAGRIEKLTRDRARMRQTVALFATMTIPASKPVSRPG